MQQRDLNKTGALAAGADSSSNGSSSSSSYRTSEKKRKRPRDSATVVITDVYNFRAKVHKFTGMPTPPATSSSEESEKMSSLLFKPKARRAELNVPLTYLPFLSSVLTNSTNSCNLPLTDHLLGLPVTEGDSLVEAQSSNSLFLPSFNDKNASNHKSSSSVSLLFEELLEEWELNENSAI